MRIKVTHVTEELPGKVLFRGCSADKLTPSQISYNQLVNRRLHFPETYQRIKLDIKIKTSGPIGALQKTHIVFNNLIIVFTYTKPWWRSTQIVQFLRIGRFVTWNKNRSGPFLELARMTSVFRLYLVLPKLGTWRRSPGIVQFHRSWNLK